MVSQCSMYLVLLLAPSALGDQSHASFRRDSGQHLKPSTGTSSGSGISLGSLAKLLTSQELPKDSAKDKKTEAKRPSGPVEGGNSQLKINISLLLIIAFVAAVMGISFLRSKSLPPGARPTTWVWGLLASSYALLIIGFMNIMFCFTATVDVMGETTILTHVGDENRAISETFFGYVRLLWKNGGVLGACALILFGIVVPILKLVLLTVAELWRYSYDKEDILKARKCISVVQAISKWACPDLFAYVLLLFLVRHIDNTHLEGGLMSTTLYAPAHLDIGFTCFSLFCMLSTVSALMMSVPEIEGEELPTAAAAVRLPAWWMSAVRKWGVGSFALILAGVSLTCLCLGTAMPCMGLRLSSDAFIEPKGPIPQMMKSVVDGMHIPDRVNANVSLLQCVKSLLFWTWQQSEFNDILAITLLVGCVFILTVLDVIALLAVVFSRQSDAAMRLSHVLRHLSMLDVCATGVIVAVMAGRVYQDQGITLFLLPGTCMLVIAELFHCFLYWTISAALVEDKAENIALEVKD